VIRALQRERGRVERGIRGIHERDLGVRFRADGDAKAERALVKGGGGWNVSLEKQNAAEEGAARAGHSAVH